MDVIDDGVFANSAEREKPLDEAGLDDGVGLDDADGGEGSREESVEAVLEGDDLVAVRVRGVQMMINRMGLNGIADNVLTSLRVVRDHQVLNSEMVDGNGRRVIRLKGGVKKRIQGLVNVKTKVEREADSRRLNHLSRAEEKERVRRRKRATGATYKKIREGGLPRIEQAQDWFVDPRSR